MADNPSNIGHFAITVDGKDLPEDLKLNLQEAVVDDDLEQPDMFTLRFNDPELLIMDGGVFKLGSTISIAGPNKAGKHKIIFIGEVTALESTLESHSKCFVVSGFDLSHRLHRGRKTRTFLQQTDADIVSQIAREAGLKADVQATSTKHNYILQNNQTDMDFLLQRAARVGYRVTVEDKNLRFHEREASPPEAPALKWGEQLLSFNMRLTGVAQPNEVQVRGWDYKTKRAVVGRKTTAVEPSKPGSAKAAGPAAQEAFGSTQTVYVTDRPVASQGEADNLAQATLNEMAGDYLAAEGMCYGEPELRAGRMVQLNEVGKRLGGKYFVNATRHEYTQDTGYRTTFFVSGHRPNSLLGAANGASGGGNSGTQTAKGVVIGIVTNVNDPEEIGRVKVKYPWLDEQIESEWARLSTLGGGQNRGMMFVPEVNDEVLVAFEHGDVNRPFIMGGLWNGKDPASVKAIEGGKVEKRSIKTRIGHNIEFYDKGAQGYIHLKTANGHIVVLHDTDKKLEIKSVKHSILMDDTGQLVKIESAGDLILKAPGGTLKITGSGVELISNSAMKVQSSAMMDVKSSAVIKIEGSLVKIN